MYDIRDYKIPLRQIALKLIQQFILEVKGRSNRHIWADLNILSNEKRRNHKQGLPKINRIKLE